MTTTPDTMTVQDQKIAVLEKLARRALAQEARAEAIAAYGRAAELAVSMGYPERVSPLERLAAYSRQEIEAMTAALYKGLDVAAAQKLAVSATA